jgi:hypothetical protein
VLDRKFSHQRASDELGALLHSCSFSTRVAQLEADGGTTDDWVCMSLRNALAILCNEADAFREAMLAAVQQSGGKHTFFRNQTYV